MTTLEFNPNDATTTPMTRLQFDNRFVRELPADPDTENVRRKVLGACYTFVNPTPVADPKLVAYGRAINLGEVQDIHGQLQMLQLKGAGETPYSRSADGLAVLRSSVREFLCSEAMFHLGVPTTRALSLITTGEGVIRDMFYDGRPQTEPGAIVCRVAPSFLRTFQRNLSGLV